MTKFTLNLTQIFEEDRKKINYWSKKSNRYWAMMTLWWNYDWISMALQMELRWQYDGASVLACAC